MSELVFIIEDDEDLSTIFADALETVGYQVEQIKDGLIAQQRLKEEVPFMILLDMHLPHVSGADFKHTYVMLTTADARQAEAYEPIADFVMVKPISFVQLRDLTARLKPQ